MRLEGAVWTAPAFPMGASWYSALIVATYRNEDLVLADILRFSREAQNLDFFFLM